MRKALIAVLGVAVVLAAVLFLFRRGDREDVPRNFAHMPSVLADAPSAIAAEILSKQGVTPVPFLTGPETAQALMAGGAFTASFAELPFLLASVNRQDLRVIAVITSANSMGVLANRSSGIQSSTDLAGKKVGFPQGTSATYVFESYFAQQGNLDRITPVNLPPPQLQPAMLRGDIQAMVIWQPFLERAKRERPDDYFYLPGSQEAFRVIMLVVSTQATIDRDPKGIELILKGLIQAENALSSGSPEVMARLRELTNLDGDTLQSILPLFRFKVVLDGEIIQTWKQLAVWANNKGMAPAEVLQRNWIEYIHTDALRRIDSSRVKL
jgi:NitT/TauT family transport system substrate-binding protein